MNQSYLVDANQKRIDEKKELKRKCELLLKIYEEVCEYYFTSSLLTQGRIQTMKESIEKYKAAGRAALDDWLQYTDEPKPEPAEILVYAGFDPSSLGLDPIQCEKK